MRVTLQRFRHQWRIALSHFSRQKSSPRLTQRCVPLCEDAPFRLQRTDSFIPKSPLHFSDSYKWWHYYSSSHRTVPSLPGLLGSFPSCVCAGWCAPGVSRMLSLASTLLQSSGIRCSWYYIVRVKSEAWTEVNAVCGSCHNGFRELTRIVQDRREMLCGCQTRAIFENWVRTFPRPCD